jgi:hypothetical protein
VEAQDFVKPKLEKKCSRNRNGILKKCVPSSTNVLEKNLCLRTFLTKQMSKLEKTVDSDAD